MKTLLLCAIVLCVVSTSAAQTPSASPQVAGDCKLKLAESPIIRGIRLGMTVDQALEVFPKDSKALRMRIESPRFGAQLLGIDPQNTEDKENFSGVRYVHLGFLDGELNFYTISYNGPSWRNEEQFASRVAETLKLPGVDSWRTVGGRKALTCDGFQISLQLSSGNTIEVRNMVKDINKIVPEREEATREQARRSFKP